MGAIDDMGNRRDETPHAWQHLDGSFMAFAILPNLSRENTCCLNVYINV
jgi:hypothetical protein